MTAAVDLRLAASSSGLGNALAAQAASVVTVVLVEALVDELHDSIWFENTWLV